MSKPYNTKVAEEAYKMLLSTLPLTDEGVERTPLRAAKAFGDLTKGYHTKIEDVIGQGVFPHKGDGIVHVKGLEICSMCEHHLLPFIGKCHVAYLPSGQVLGLSKFARIVAMYARRLQIQENLTKQIADAVQQVTGAKGVGVIIEAKHMCMMMRGVEKQNSVMKSSVMLGRFRDNAQTRNEFLSLIKD